jgi:hypothetical protein
MPLICARTRTIQQREMQDWDGDVPVNLFKDAYLRR